MKTSNILLLTALVIILIGITTFVGFFKTHFEDNCVEGKGPVVEKVFETDPFKDIYINNKLNVEITQDTFQKVTIEAEENLIDNFSVVVINDQLKISRIYCMKKSKNALVKISVNSLERIKVQSGGTVRTTNTLTGEKLDINANSGAEINLDLSYSQLYCNLSAGAICILKGSTESLQTDLNAGSILKAAKLTTENCTVLATSGSQATVNVTGEISVNANSGANVRYLGEPVKKNIDVSSGANFNKIDD